MKILCTATCLFGLEGLLGEEIEKLGYQRVENMDGRITFEGDEWTAAVCNIHLRYAERLYLHLGSFEAKTFTELFDGTKALAWEDFIGREDAFPVSGHAIKSQLFSVPDCQRIIKKAIVNRLGERYGLTQLPETGVRYKVEFFLFKDRASLMIDLSGNPLHKRGYRPETVAAPLRETLAAAMVLLTRYRGRDTVYDTFCGSGTIPIEAALLMTNTAPGSFRSFVSEDFFDISPKVWSNARDEAASLQKLDTEFTAYASDISPQMVEKTQANVKRAGIPHRHI